MTVLFRRIVFERGRQTKTHTRLNQESPSQKNRARAVENVRTADLPQTQDTERQREAENKNNEVLVAGLPIEVKVAYILYSELYQQISYKND
jgi:hypothetical protein